MLCNYKGQHVPWRKIKRDGESWSRGLVMILNRVMRVDFSYRVIFEQGLRVGGEFSNSRDESHGWKDPGMFKE